MLSCSCFVNRGYFAAEAHLLHYSFTTDTIIYVSILLEESADKLPFTNNSFLDSLWDSRTVSDIASEYAVRHGRVINPYEEMFPGTYSHFNYVGSLTTPPCTPGAKWFIFDTPVPISSDDVAIIRSSIATVPDSKRSQQGNTNRPVQPKNGRELYYSFGINSKSQLYIEENSCDNEDAKQAKLLSMIAVGVSSLILMLFCFMFHKLLCIEKDRENKSDEVLVLDHDDDDVKHTTPPAVVDSNPLQQSRTPSHADSVL
jgi:hypothetical protein